MAAAAAKMVTTVLATALVKAARALNLVPPGHRGAVGRRLMEENNMRYRWRGANIATLQMLNVEVVQQVTRKVTAIL